LHASGFSDEEIEEEIARSKEAPIPPPEVLEPQEEAAAADSDESPSDQEIPAKRKKKKSKEAEEDAAAESNAPNFFAPVLTIEEEIADLDLTEEDVTYLKLKWGVGYRPSEWVKMEQLYEDMMASYDIQTAGHKDTLVMLCKTSLKANQFLDQGDIDAFQKMSRAYDTLMKSGKFTAA
jgi:hypothetical protein